MLNIFTSLLLGLLMILDPCTLFTGVAAIGYIDRELHNRRRVLVTGLMFVLGKLVTYMLLAIPFIMGAQTHTMHHFMSEWGEPLLCVFMLLCGILLLFAGHHHHDHDHGMTKWLQTVDDRSSWLWAFMLGIFFAIAFCPHRLVYFFTMIDLAVAPGTSTVTQWLLPLMFGLGTGLPIMIMAWAISYTALSQERLMKGLHRFEHWFRIICAVLFLGYGLYLAIHLFTDSPTRHHHHHHEHTELSIPAV